MPHTFWWGGRKESGLRNPVNHKSLKNCQKKWFPAKTSMPSIHGFMAKTHLLKYMPDCLTKKKKVPIGTTLLLSNVAMGNPITMDVLMGNSSFLWGIDMQKSHVPVSAPVSPSSSKTRKSWGWQADARPPSPPRGCLPNPRWFGERLYGFEQLLATHRQNPKPSHIRSYSCTCNKPNLQNVDLLAQYTNAAGMWLSGLSWPQSRNSGCVQQFKSYEPQY